MPPDEAGTIHPLAEAAGLDVIFLLAPTSTAKRETAVGRLSHGFIYHVSMTGSTSAQLTDQEAVAKKGREVLRSTKTPAAEGVGIATPRDARQVGANTDRAL